MTIPFWIILITLIVIGIVGCEIIMRYSGDYDFVTPLLAVGFAGAFILLSVGLALGKYVF